jgi:hypothetical protein
MAEVETKEVVGTQEVEAEEALGVEAAAEKPLHNPL